MKFTDLGLSEALLKAVLEEGYSDPTPIQAQAIPAVLKGQDIMASAQTGTGKTAGFTLPLLHKLADMPRARGNHTRALILTPTRELAAQVHASIETYGRYLNLRSAVVFGGVKINPQMMKLRSGVEILVATPGRLLDLYQQNAIRFDEINTLVLDEADRMLDMGFIHDIRRILALLPKQRQNLLFSATYSKEIQTLAKGLLHNPVQISVTPVNTATELVEQTLYLVDKARKTDLLRHLIKAEGWYQALVFSRTKHGANKIVKQLESAGIHAAAIHGNKSQAHRTKVLDSFKEGLLQILVATDIAARGIDIDQLPQVVNYDLPQVPEDYVHRIGRTGRAGATGRAISFACPDENKQLRDIERLLKRPITRAALPKFEVSQPTAESASEERPANRRESRPAAAQPRRPSAKTQGRTRAQNSQRRDERPQRAPQARTASAPRNGDEARSERPRRRRRSPSAGRQNKPNASGVTLLYRS